MATSGKDGGGSEATKPSKGLQPDPDENPYFHPLSSKFRKLPAWLDHFNRKDLKILLKCSLAVWIYSLLIWINPTLVVMGQASFFGAIVLFIVPPSSVIFIGLAAGLTLVLGVCLGWTWGVITMKAALATRPAADVAARYAQLQQTAPATTTNTEQASGQSSFTQIAIFDGYMLDTRVSLTFFCMLGLFVYLMARLRVKAPKLGLLTTFAIVISDIFLTIAPLIPQFQGTIPQTLIKPAAIAIGIGLACNVLFFPRSTSHVVLDAMQDVLAPMQVFLQACLIDFQHPTKHMNLDRLNASRAKVIEAYKALESSLAFLTFDASMGRWSADNVLSLHEPLRQILVTFIALMQVQISREEHRLKDEKLREIVLLTGNGHEEGKKAGHHEMMQTFDFRQRSLHPDSDRLLEQSLLALSFSSEDILTVCQQALRAVTAALRDCNTRRWINRPSAQEIAEGHQAHVMILEKLRRLKSEFAGQTADRLWDHHTRVLDGIDHLKENNKGTMSPAAGLMLSLVLEERIYNFVEALEALLARVVLLEEQRDKTKLWLPSSLVKLFSWALDDELVFDKDVSTAEAPFAETTPSKKEKKKRKSSKKGASEQERGETVGESAASQLANMQAHGGRVRNKSSRFLVSVTHWLGSTEGLYALRVLTVTIALGVPAVIPRTAGFYYREKGLWALIMAQTGLLPYSADFVVGLILRLVGTVVGAVIGLAAWYIGAGSGPGNPYGMAAIMAPVIIVLMWLRLFLPPATMQATIVTVATCYLVVGYSWNDTHIPSYGNPGVGYSVFWRRMLLVIIGFGAAAIVTFIPRPPSAGRHHRRLLSECLQTVKDRYSLLVLNCRKPVSDLQAVSEKLAIDTGQVLLEIEPMVELTRFEFSTSNFDARTLGQVCHLCMDLNQSVSQLLFYVPMLPDHLKARFIRVTGIMDERVTADIMAVLTMVQEALRTEHALPAVLPIPLLARSVQTARARLGKDEESGSTITPQLLAEESSRKYCSAMVAYVQLLSSMDELMIVVKRSLGETGSVLVETQQV